MTIELGLAIGWKFNDVRGVQTIDGKITKFPEIDGVILGSDGFPTAEDQAKWLKEYEDHLASTEYQRDRDYGSIGDQLDMQYWDGVNDTTVWTDHIATVKAAHPKPE